jgi:hypothetical protein
MISRHPALEKAVFIGVGLLLFLPVSADLLYSSEPPQPVVVTSVGMGAPPGKTEPPESSPAPTGAVEDAGKKAILSYLYTILGPEVPPAQDAVDTLILPIPELYYKNQILSYRSCPGECEHRQPSTIDAAALPATLKH